MCGPSADLWALSVHTSAIQRAQGCFKESGIPSLMVILNCHELTQSRTFHQTPRQTKAGSLQIICDYSWLMPLSPIWELAVLDREG